MILSSTINLLLNSKVVIRQIPLGHAHRSPSQQSGCPLGRGRLAPGFIGSGFGKQAFLLD